MGIALLLLTLLLSRADMFKYGNVREGCVIAQEVSGQLPTAAAHVLSRVKSCWICGEQSFLLVILIPTAAHSSSNIQGWCSRSNSGWYIKYTYSYPIQEIKN
jgi:hypothetical protein